MEYDVVILGAGSAGLSAALYSARRALKTLVLTKDFGGQTALAVNIENYPGISKIDGLDFMQRIRQQAEAFGVEIKLDAVTGLVQKDGDFAIATASGDEYTAKTVILAFGRTPRFLGVPGEMELLGKGVAYCATCDAPLFAGKDVAVIGGGNNAISAALILSDIANKVYVVHRREEFRAEEIRLAKLKKLSPVELILNSAVVEIKGDPFVNKLVVKNINTEVIKELSVQGVFIEIGSVVHSDWLGDLVKFNEQKEIIIDKFNQTSLPGVFAAGDATEVPYKQMIIAAGEGAKAALAAYDYLKQRIN